MSPSGRKYNHLTLSTSGGKYKHLTLSPSGGKYKHITLSHSGGKYKHLTLSPSGRKYKHLTLSPGGGKYKHLTLSPSGRKYKVCSILGSLKRNFEILKVSFLKYQGYLHWKALHLLPGDLTQDPKKNVSKKNSFTSYQVVLKDKKLMWKTIFNFPKLKWNKFQSLSSSAGLRIVFLWTHNKVPITLAVMQIKRSDVNRLRLCSLLNIGSLKK